MPQSRALARTLRVIGWLVFIVSIFVSSELGNEVHQNTSVSDNLALISAIAVYLLISGSSLIFLLIMITLARLLDRSDFTIHCIDIIISHMWSQGLNQPQQQQVTQEEKDSADPSQPPFSRGAKNFPL